MLVSSYIFFLYTDSSKGRVAWYRCVDMLSEELTGEGSSVFW